ncbi:MAG: hypothetical protein ACKPBV_12145, partial [Sphaerospermopsis kisseleviana]
MPKIRQTLITWLLVAFLIVTAIPLVVAQQTPSPQPKPSISQSVDAPLIFDGEKLFVIKQGLGISAQNRAQAVSARLLKFAEDNSISLENIQVYVGDKEGIPLTIILAGSIPITALSDFDVQEAGKTRAELAQEYVQKIKEAVRRYRQERSLKYLLLATLWTVLATVTLIVTIFIVNNIFARIYHRLKVWGETSIRPVQLGNWELIRANQLDNFITWLARLTQALIVLGLLIAYFPFVLEQFPWTRGLAKTFEGSVLGTVKAGWQAFVNYLPSLLTIVLVVAVTVFLVRLSKPFFRELGQGTFSVPGFYPEWAEA